MKRFILLSLMLLWAIPATAKPLITVVAMVNNDAVTSYQLEKKLATIMAADTAKNRLSKEEHQALRLKVLNSMIEDLLVEQRIHELGLAVSDQEIDSAIEDVQQQNKLTRDQLKTALEAQGMSFASYRQNLRKEILRYRLISREVRSKIEVTKAQIRTYFEAHKNEFKSLPTLHLVRISYPIPKEADAKTKEILMQKAQIARQLLLAGKPFAEVLKQLGDAAEGGDMGVVIEQEMNPQLRQMIAGLQAGQVSSPQEALGSIHLFKVVSRTPAKAELSDEIRTRIEKILAKQNSEKRFAEWKKGLRKDAVIDIRI